MAILILVLQSFVPVLDPRILKTRYGSQNINKTYKNMLMKSNNSLKNRIELLKYVFKGRKDHMDKICKKYKARDDSKLMAEKFGGNYKHRLRVRN